MEVNLHIYDVTNSGSAKTNNTIVQINKIFKDGIGLGGIFHSAVQVSLFFFISFNHEILGESPALIPPPFGNQDAIITIKAKEVGGGVVRDSQGKLLFIFAQALEGMQNSCMWLKNDEENHVSRTMELPWKEGYPDFNILFAQNQILAYIPQVYGDEEWSFGFCEQGSGVFSCPPSKNPMYTYRECIVLGKTNCSLSRVKQILRELSREWPGHSYDLLAKNCNHFCDELCERLGVPKLPGWVNRFANAGDTAMEVAGNAAFRFRQAKTEIVTASKVAYQFLSTVTSKTATTPDTLSDSNRGRSIPKFQPAWFKNLVSSIGNQPSPSSNGGSQLEEDRAQETKPRQLT
ncbi:hypothetical protein GIB67_008320 [Kingdonia uniflora]|uniref:PPPDE domain-containing protein n=1 Tax=Kingdonia uniflora TaxID=39325 RepID=A0A7J7N4R3_9MAGN|nr:hypothetical protein GIB67_008320 [Kingdonia uniflora]